MSATEEAGGGHAWQLVRRTVYLLLGGAVAGAFLILSSAIYAPLQPSATEIITWLFLAMTLVPMALVGLLPGVREIQVAGAQSLLGVEEAMVPEPMRTPHRLRTALWTFLHQVIGVLAGLLLLLCALTVATLLMIVIGAGGLEAPGLTIGRPATALGWIGLVLAAAATIAVSSGLIVAGGVGAAWSAPLLLGPLGEDRLVLAEQRLARERGYRRVSRDLHDGVGHSLSAISLQAAAARRVLERAVGSGGDGSPDDTDATRPAQRATESAQEALRTIAELADRAVDELDHALAVLREDPAEPRGDSGAGGSAPRRGDPAADRRPVRTVGGADLTRLTELVEEHRGRGMEVLARVRTDPGDLPGVPSRTAYRVCAEALANAAKHGGTGPVHLEVTDQATELEVTVRNPLPATSAVAAPPRTGRGLAGLREAVELVGGDLTAGPVASSWTVHASLPRGVRRG